MKLLTKTTLYFLAFMVPLLAGGGYFLFSQFSREINDRVDKELVYEELQWLQYIESITSNGTDFVLRAPDLLIYPTGEPPSRYPRIEDSYGTKVRENKRILFRQLSHIVPVNGVLYHITIRKSQEQKAALVGNITWIMLLVFLGLFAGTLLFNWFISRELWQPFRTSLQKMNSLALERMETARFEHTNVTEFNELNAALNTMTQRIHRDFTNMKEFTENAAHEMQTPLAVAQSKLELLLQDPALREAQLEIIADATIALSRLSKLNQSLLLLAKIENQQFVANEIIDLEKTIEKYLGLFEEMINNKQLTVTKKIDASFSVHLHPFLADSLISNLLGNSVKYNLQGGKITITSDRNALTICNTSPLAPIPPEEVFQRFKASQHPSGSTGLGLSIVKKIADNYGLIISYDYKESQHCFCLKKSSNALAL